MQEDPLAIALTGGDMLILPYLIRAMVGAIAFMCGDIYAAFNEHGAMVGFQGWVPPGKLLFSTEEQRERLEDFNVRLSDKAKEYFPKAMGVDFPKAIDDCTGIENCELNAYWCNFNFVVAEYQQRGISKAMSELAYQKAKPHKWIMALATTHVRNIAIYNHLRFELMGYRNMASPFIDWPAWIYMRRT
ncbi:uncharacterized protein C8Q71DRAFT_747302 [Rhodofomes roseus]|nr:uncharacterized protein C8Q71DRAFT_747302 [Rhodofomes roseus]KAH9839041.1 hypothetical protein C8Q71DRAFT_747302 [Rhodofomes roseus]